MRAVCPHNCPDTCGLLVDVEDGKVVKVDGDPTHPVTRGFICEKVRRYPHHVESARRVLYPKRRTGPKGSGTFERIGWDEALDDIAARLHSVIGRYGGEAVLPYSYSGTLGILQSESMDRRFFNKLGASRLHRAICSGGSDAALLHSFGSSIGADPETSVDAKLIVVWGMNVRSTNIHQYAFVQEARKRGARLVVVDPHRNRTAESADRFVRVRPGTDAALALGMMHVIFAEERADRPFLAERTTGAAELEARARAWPPERASSVCGVPVDEIVSFAREYASVKPSLLRSGYGLQRHTNGGQLVRALIALAATVGGGYLASNSGAFRYNRRALQRPDLACANTRSVNMVQLGAALETLGDPPVKALFVYNANPAAVTPDGNAVARGLAREDLFTVVHDIYHTDTVDYADIVLPAPTFLETEDVYTSYWHLHLQHGPAVIPPRGESRSNVELFTALAARMGFEEPCFRDGIPELTAAMFEGSDLARQGITPERLQAEGRIRVEAKSPAKIALRAEALAREQVDPLPTHVALAESREGSPQLFARYPLHFLTPSHHLFLNSTFGSDPGLLGRAEPSLRIHPDDARARGIAHGTPVEVFNDRGRVRLTAEVTDAVAPGVVVHLSLWWRKFSGGANANATTSQAPTDIGGGATFHTNLVEVTPVCAGTASRT